MHLTITQISTRLLRPAVLAILSWALAASGVFAQVIVQYAGTTTASTTTATNTTNTAISSSAGTISNPCTSPLNILRVANGTFNQATPTNYLQFTVKPAAGYQFSVTNISIDAKRNTAGPPNGRIDYSANGGAFSTGTNATVTSLTGCFAPPTISRSVSGVNITDATNGLVVRVYFWAATTAAGQVEFANVTVNGTVSILPAAPTLTSPTAASITQNSAVLGATITIDGGASISERGTVYKTTAGVTATDNPLAEGGTTTGAFSHTRTGLSPQTQYFYKGYAVNTNGTGLSSEGSFRTLSNPPTGAASNLTATLATTTSADLSWTGGTFPASDATKYGYLVLRSAATPGLVASPNGLAPASALSSGTVLVSNIETTAPTAPGTAASATGLSVATTHTFTIIPYTWDGTNTSTYHYLTSGAPTASLTLNPNIYTWVGDDGGSRTDAANWSPASVPTTDDAVLFDGAYGEVINVPTVSLSWLRFEGGSFVILRAATTATVSVTGGSAPQFGVENSSYVVLGGTAALTINVANGVGSIYGDLVFEKGAHRLNATNANAITFHNGSSFTSGNPDNPGFSGNPFGTTGTANIVYFDQGSLYFHNEGANPFGLTAPASRVVFHKFSDYFVQPASSTTLAASGRTYGNLWIINGSTVTGSGPGDFTFTSIYVEGGSSFSFTGSGTNAIYVRGDIYNDDALTLNAGTGALNFSDSLTHEIYAYADLTMRRVVVGTGTLLNLSEGSFICNTSCVVNGELNMFYSVISGTGTFTLNAGGILHTAATDGLSATGSLALSGTKTMSSNATYYYDAFDFQYTGEHLPASVSKLFAYNALELTQSLTVTQEMEMNDIVTTGAANKLTIPTTTTFNVFGGHVNGTLEKGISAGVDKLVSFEVGDAVYFAPIDMTFDIVNTGGMISVKTEPTDHPEIGSSIFDPNFTANRYWTISGTGVTFQTYGLAAIWDYFDLDAGVLTPNLFGGVYHNSAWTYPTIDYQDYTSAGISGITTFGELQFGECVAPTVTGVVTDESCAGNFDGAINLTVSGGTAPYAFLWDNGDETEDITDLTAGTYTVTVTATGLCETVKSLTVNATPATTYYADADGDTYGNAAVSQMSCTPISGYVTNDDDCNDANANINPGATEICNNIDDNCDGTIDNVPGGCGGSPDADMDGYTIAQGDCDDSNANVNPAATEICNLIDDNCDGNIDEGVQSTFYADTDGDTYGDAGSTTLACTAPSGFVANDDDCDDSDANVNPAATEICNLIDDDCDGNIDEGVQSTFYADTDGDTYGDAGSTTLACTAPSGFVANDDDCDDSDANVNPAATEICNLIDDNCDGNIDEGVQSTFYADTDGDTYGDAGSTTLACTAPSGFVANDDDCDDSDANVNPAATEICNLIDDDCDGNIDEGVQSTFYADTDGDTYGDAGSTTLACTAPSGFVANDDDCDDSDANVNPAATEICNLIDDNCDGNIDEGTQSTFFADTDGDTYGDAGSTTQACTAPSGFVANDDDCDDSNANVNPAATEICNLIDDNCDGNIDEGVQSTFYADTDGDTYGDAGSTTQACTAPSGFVANDDDCDDSNANVNPAATEVCNLIDDDCDGNIDEGVQSTFYADTDGDTYGDAGSTTQACTAPSGFVANDDDCDDSNANVNPAATEICNLIDDNCDGNIDEGVQSTFYADTDGDTYGDAGSTTQACTAPSGFVANDDDCDDSNANVNPAATEICNLIDDDCDGSIDEGVQLTFFADTDGDTFGDAGSTTLACTAPSGFVANDDDCDDSNANVNPAATEVCNLIDDNCDGNIDEGTQSTFFADTDGDTYGDAGSTTLACTAPSGFVANDDDCDDSNANVNPAATEICNLIDDNCDGNIDEGTQSTFFADTDGDTYGDAGSTTQACTAPSGFVANDDDCDDSNANVNPAATEICNLIDDNCDGNIDEGTQSTFYADTDGDTYGDAGSTTLACTAPSGFVANDDDCDDSNANVNPAATEVCNLIDDNCDGNIDEGTQSTFFADTDGDTYGDAGSTTLACTAPSGFVANDDDCDDSNANVNPAATEICNLIDDNCDGNIDEGTQSTFFADTDGDTYGDAGSTTQACTAPSGFVANDDDCDDSNANVNPAATEICNLIDDNCDGNIDEGTQSTFYADTDGDTYGDAGSTTLACTAPSGFVANDDDCDDSNANVNPAATEVCNLIDDNCDGNIDEGTQSTFYADTDGDTYGDAGSTTLACTAPSGFVANDDDCDDSNANVNPAATEICNLIDDDCDGNIDEGVQSTFYADTDGDTYGDAGSTTLACTAPSGFVANDDDCDDSNANVNPAATEICNLIDDDCDGNIDEGVQSTFYADTDGDTYGDAGSTTQACTAPSGFVANDDDCDDSNANVNPAATEICNLIDDNCDGNIDEGTQSTFFADTDGDTYGDAGSTTLACTAPSGFVANDDDCDDSNANVNPAATEICNLIDDNCDGNIDEGTQSTFFADTDGDTYGDAGSTTQACTAPSGFVANDDDCDDSNANVNPAATEICNLIDDNCDGNIDEGVQSTFYADTDGDTYGDAGSTTLACTAPSGFVANDDDCDDSNANVNPAATEICNLIDDNCDGNIDEGVQSTFYADTDGDTYGDAGSTTLACTAPSGFVANDDDCDDSNANVNPAATEICNLIDDNCDGNIDEGVQSTFYADTDGDTYGDAGSTTQACTAPSGFVANDDDCDDSNANVNPAATEICNGIDDDCDGDVDEGGAQITYYADADGDTYGDPAVSQLACTPPTGFVTNDDDCNDANAAINPAATEICNNGTDENCDASDGITDMDATLTPDCNMANGNAVAISGVVGGAAPLQYSSDNGATYQASANFTGLTPGSYTFVTQDAAGCTASESVTINAPMSTIITGANPNCAGGSDGSVSASVTGGYAPLSYSWTNSMSVVVGTTASVTGLPAGIYNLSVTDDKGCVASGSFSLSDPSMISVTLLVASTPCFGEANGVVNSTVSGGQGGYSYLWSNGSTTANISNAAAGTHTVTVTDIAGCQKTASVTVGTKPQLKVSTTTKNVTCAGYNDGTASANGTGGTGSNSSKTYLWSTGATTKNITGLSAGNYTVTVTDVAGCTISKTVTINEPAPLVLALTHTPIVCNGQGNGTGSANATGGTGGKTYVWSTGSTAKSISYLGAGTYTVTATDTKMCQITGSFTLTEPPVLAITNIISAPSGTKYRVTVTATGGVPPLKYRRNTATGFTGANTTGIFTGLVAGTYTFRVEDANGCIINQVQAIPVVLNLTGKNNGQQAQATAQSLENVDFTLQPNPARSTAQLVFDRTQPTDGMVEIRSVSGALLRQISVENLAANGWQFQLDGLSHGVMLVSLRSGDAAPVTKRLVILD